MRFAFIALAALGLSGCIELPGSGPAPNYYTISALDGATEKLPAPVLFLEDPTAPGELSGRELAVARDNGQIAFVAQSIWAERTQSMVLRHLVTSFDHLSRYSTVGGVRSLDVPSDYSLKLDLRRFHALDGGRVEVEIADRKSVV